MKQHAPAAERNRGPIADVLAAHLPARGAVLEVASGTGQHVVFFAERFTQLIWQATDVNLEQLGNISARIDEARRPNLPAPLQLDVALPVWPVSSPDALVCINLLHISPWGCCVGLFAGAARTLSAHGLAYVYGPFNVDGRHTSEGNAAFDARLRERDAALGLREVTDVERLADAHGFDAVARICMPANNLSLVFRKRPVAHPHASGEQGGVAREADSRD